MAQTIRAPKQWQLTKNETITSFEAWRQNLLYTLALDANFANFLVDGSTWGRKTSNTPLRGFTDDPGDGGRTAAQKVAQLELLLGQIANYCPVIARNTIVKNSTSINNIWQSIRLHYGFQSTGGHFLDLNNIKLENDERPEDLFQRLSSFVDDNLLKGGGSISHHGEVPENDEETTPTVENFIVLSWLRLIHPNLPALVKQKYATELRSRTLASLKPEISLAIPSLLDEVHTLAEAKVLRSTFKKATNSQSLARPNRQTPSCPICKQAGRSKTQHFLSKCKFLPEEDKKYISTSGKVRQSTCIDSGDEDDDLDEDSDSGMKVSGSTHPVVHSTRRVCTKQSPVFKAFYGHYPLTLTLDSGAEISMIKQSVADHIGAHITKTNQSALQADGLTPLSVVGETHIVLTRNGNELVLEALVVNDIDVDVLAGIPFMVINDIAIRPAKHEIRIGDSDSVYYGTAKSNKSNSHVRRTKAFVLRAQSTSSVVWPGTFVELSLPEDIGPDESVAIEPKYENEDKQWFKPQVIDAVGGYVRIPNNTHEPQRVTKHEHIGFVRSTVAIDTDRHDDISQSDDTHNINTEKDKLWSSCVSIDPDVTMSEENQAMFKSLVEKYDNVFSPNIDGYNGAVGKFESVINMGPVQPPQRKGRIPQYNKNKLVELQQKFDELESQGVFSRPEDIGVTAEYINPSFLVKKPNGGYRLVTAFSDVGRYSKPQPSLMPDCDSTLRTIGQWKYIIKSDLTSAFYQIPLAKQSMKYCGVVTPFRGVRVYRRCAMGMPGSETALEELMCRVLGDLVQDGCVAKLADDLYCGANTIEDLLVKFERVLVALSRSGLRLSPTKTSICPKTTCILGWIWSSGKLSASPHRIATLSSCPRPDTVKGLRSFIGAYKVLGRVLPQCSSFISPLDDLAAGKQSQDKITWTEPYIKSFQDAQAALHKHRSIVIPRPSDQLWIVTDGSVSKRGVGATLYVMREDKLSLAGFFSAKLRKHQITWLPCEIEALSIATAVKHFSPYIIQSDRQVCVLTDSQPCVQAAEKLCRGEFSASPRVSTFLSIVSRYQVNIRHLAGSANVPSDFASRNAPDCSQPNCQICTFIYNTEESVVRSISIDSIVSGTSRIPFATRSAWLQVQSECPDLRRTHAYLKQGTRPSKKLTKIKDVKRYLQVASIAKDNLLVVKRQDPLLPPSELIVVPRSVLDGLVNALHIKLDHPSRHQLELVMKRHFYALDLHEAVEQATRLCHLCESLKTLPESSFQQSSEDPPDVIGVSFAADILKRNCQLILVVRETVTSYTRACFVCDEKRDTLREALACLCTELLPLEGPPAIVRVDPAPGFVSLQSDETLKRLNIVLEIGRVKNVNKNPVAERAIQELEGEILRYDPGGGPLSSIGLSIVVSRLNSRLRKSGLSSRELWTQRSQFTNEQLPISDRNIIIQQHESRIANHPYSVKSKSRLKPVISDNSEDVCIGDLVYLKSDKSKLSARGRYLVVSCDGEWCFVKKFSGNQLRSSSYKVKRSECYRVPTDKMCSEKRFVHSYKGCDSDEETDIPTQHLPPQPVTIPTTLTQPAYPPGDSDPVPIVIGESVPLSTDESHPQIAIETSTDIAEPIVSRPQRIRKPPSHLADYVLD